jgi:hypothetical protein
MKAQDIEFFKIGDAGYDKTRSTGVSSGILVQATTNIVFQRSGPTKT